MLTQLLVVAPPTISILPLLLVGGAVLVDGGLAHLEKAPGGGPLDGQEAGLKTAYKNRRRGHDVLRLPLQKHANPSRHRVNVRWLGLGD